MTAKRLFIILVSVMFLSLIGIAGSVYAMSGLFKTKGSQLASNKAQVDLLTKQQAGIAKSKRDITRYAELEKITKAIVPQDKDQAETVREITNIAAANSVEITAITFPNSSLGSAAAKTPTAAVPSGGAATSGVDKKAALSQLTQVANIPGVYNLQITISNNTNHTVSFSQLNAFLRGLENNRHTAAVSTVNIQPIAGNPNKLVFSLTINDYIKPS